MNKEIEGHEVLGQILSWIQLSVSHRLGVDMNKIKTKQPLIPYPQKTPTKSIM